MLDIMVDLKSSKGGSNEKMSKLEDFFFTASIFNVEESGYMLLSKYTNRHHLRLQRPLLLPLE